MTRDPAAANAAIEPDDTALGSIATSNTHMDYVAQVFRDDEREQPPAKQDYGFGQPVYAVQPIRGEPHAVVGVVYDSQLVDPDQGRDGPRLAAPEQELFVPGYVDEKQTLLGIALLGYARLEPLEDPAGESGGEGVTVPHRFRSVSQSMPRWTLEVDDFVFRLPAEGVRQFHVQNGQFRMEYYQRLISTARMFGPEVTLELLERVRSVSDVGEELLDVIEQKVRWRSSTDRGVVR